jgi:hypothetical protein
MLIDGKICPIYTIIGALIGEQLTIFKTVSHCGGTERSGLK